MCSPLVSAAKRSRNTERRITRASIDIWSLSKVMKSMCTGTANSADDRADYDAKYFIVVCFRHILAESFSEAEWRS